MNSNLPYTCVHAMDGLNSTLLNPSLEEGWLISCQLDSNLQNSQFTLA